MTARASDAIVALTVAYDGTTFAGWQEQPDRPTVQGALRDALARIHGVPRARIRLDGAGRTDAGVHALGQVASYAPPTPREPATLCRALAGILPPTIRVLDAAPRPGGFHARRSAVSKRYRYRIANRSVVLPFEAPHAWQIERPLDTAAMRAAARPLVGTHDFAAFAAAGSPVASTVRKLIRLDVSCGPGGTVAIDAVADGFLYRMVRNVVGVLVEAGSGRRAPADVASLLASRDRGRGAPTAPPHGLCLVEVHYGSQHAGDRVSGGA